SGRLDVYDDSGVLSRAAGLLLVGVLDLLHLAADGLPVGHLRPADIRLDPELPAHPVDKHLEVQLTHACDERLTSLLVGAYLERGILLGKPLDRRGELLLVALAPRLDGDVDDRRWEAHRLEDDGCFRTGEGVAGGGVLEAHHGNDLAGTRLPDLLALVRVHPVDLADPLLAALDAVEHLRARPERAGVDPEIRELAEVWITHDLECEGGERCLRVG